MTAVTLADGLVFNHGPAAQYLTGLPRAPVTLDARMRHVRQLIDNALMSHPSQASTFAQQVQSGNRVQVLHALQWLGGITRAAINAVYGTAATDRAITQANEMIGKAASARSANPGIGVADPQNLPVYIYVVVVVVILVAVALTAALTTPDSPGGLATDEYVNLVASRLQTA